MEQKAVNLTVSDIEELLMDFITKVIASGKNGGGPIDYADFDNCAIDESNKPAMTDFIRKYLADHEKLRS